MSDLNDRVRWQTYKGVRILVEDLTNLNSDDVITLFNRADDLTIAADHDVFMLMDCSGGTLDHKVVKALKSPRAKQSARIIKKSAIIGLDNVKAKMMNFYNSVSRGNAKAFDTKKEAVLWLVEGLVAEEEDAVREHSQS